MPQVSGSLLHVLRYGRKAWYASVNGFSAYYEQPDIGKPGMFSVNGKRLLQLVVDSQGLYWDHPSPRTEKLITQAGVSLKQGWTGEAHTTGTDVLTAINQSHLGAAQHTDGIRVLVEDKHRVALFIENVKQWSIPNLYLYRALIELGASPYDGWAPSEVSPESRNVPIIPIVVHRGESVPRSCFGGQIIVPIEGEGQSDGVQKLTISGLSIELLQKIVPHIPGLQNCRCSTNTVYGEIRTVKIFPQSTPAPADEPALITLWFSTAEPNFPPGVPAQALVELIQIGYYYGLQERAMCIEVNDDGSATKITLLEKDWQQKRRHLAE